MIMKHKNTISILTILLFILIFIEAYYLNAKVLTITEENIQVYLDSLSVYCISQDQNGVMWFGTNEGLRYFDYRSKGYPKTYQKINMLQNVHIKKLIRDLNKRLWCLTEKSDLFYYSTIDKQWKKPVLETEPAQERLNETFIHVDKKNRIWFGSYSKIFCYSSVRKMIQEIKVDFGDLQNKLVDLSSIIDIGKEQYLLLEYNGPKLFLMRYDINSNILSLHKVIYSTKWEQGWRMIQSRFNSDIIFIATGETLYQYNVREQSIEIIDEYQKTIVFQVFIDNDEYVWIANRNEIRRIEKNNNTSVFSESNGLLKGDYYCIFQDLNENYWIGTVDGLIKINNPLSDLNERINNAKHTNKELSSLCPSEIVIENITVNQSELIDNQAQIKKININPLNPNKKFQSGNITYTIKANPDIKGLSILYSICGPTDSRCSEYSSNRMFPLYNLTKGSYDVIFKAKYSYVPGTYSNDSGKYIRKKDTFIVEREKDLEIDEKITFPGEKIEDKLYITLNFSNKYSCDKCFSFQLNNEPFSSFQSNRFRLPLTLRPGKHRLNIIHKDPRTKLIDKNIYSYPFIFVRTPGKPLISNLSKDYRNKNILKFTFKGIDDDQYNQTPTGYLLYSSRLIPLNHLWSTPSQCKYREYTEPLRGKYLFQVKTIDRYGNESIPEELSFHVETMHAVQNITRLFVLSIKKYLVYLIALVVLISVFAYCIISSKKIERSQKTNERITKDIPELGKDTIENHIIEEVNKHPIYLIGRRGTGRTRTLTNIQLFYTEKKNYEVIHFSLKENKNILEQIKKIDLVLNKKKTKVFILLDDFDMIKFHLSNNQIEQTTKNMDDSESNDNKPYQELIKKLVEISNNSEYCTKTYIIASGTSPVNFKGIQFNHIPLSYNTTNDSNDIKKMLQITFDFDNDNPDPVEFIKNKTNNTIKFMKEIIIDLRRAIPSINLEKSYNNTVNKHIEIFMSLFRSIEKQELKDKIFDCINQKQDIILDHDEALQIFKHPNNLFFYPGNKNQLLYDKIPFVNEIINSCDLKRGSPYTTIFVSYNTDDKESVTEIVDKLKTNHIEVQWDEQFQVGSEWKEVIKELILRIRTIIVIIGKSGLGDAQKATEIDFIRNVYKDHNPKGDFKIITCFLCESNPTIEKDLDEFDFLKSIHLIEKQENLNMLVDKILSAIKPKI